MDEFSDFATTQAFLETLMPAPKKLNFLAMGWFTRVFSFESEGQAYVFRVAASAEHVHHGAVAYSYLAEYVPLPAVIRQGSYEDIFWSIQQRCQGETLTQVLKFKQPFETMSFVSALLSLHQAPVSSFERAQSWKSHLQACHDYDVFTHEGKLLDRGLFVALQSELRSLASEKFPSHYWIHGDMKPDNTIIYKGEVSGFVDWATFSTGDFLYDIANFLFYYPQKKQMQELLMAHYASAGFDLSDYAARFRCYFLHAGLKVLWENSIRYQPEKYDRAKSLLTPDL